MQLRRKKNGGAAKNIPTKRRPPLKTEGNGNVKKEAVKKTTKQSKNG